MKISTLLILCASVSTHFSTLGAQDPWQVLSPTPVAGAIRSVAFGENTFVAAGANLVYSTDNGASWTNGSTFPNAKYEAVTYGDGRFVAVGSHLAYSDDGQTWIVNPLPLPDRLLTVVFGANRFVATGEGGLIATSLDGATWQFPARPVSDTLAFSTFGNGRFILAANSTTPPNTIYGPRFLSSTDGLNWTAYAPNFGNFFDGLVGLDFQGTHFVAQLLKILHVGGTRVSLTRRSTDGVTWELYGSNGPEPDFNMGKDTLEVSNGELILFPAGRDNNRAYVSKDATVWTPFNLGPNRSIDGKPPGIAYGGGTYVIGGTTDIDAQDPFLLIGTSLASLAKIDKPENRFSLSSIAANGPTLVATSSDRVPDSTGAAFPAPFLVSTNGGAEFFTLPVPANNIPFGNGGPASIHFAQNKFVAVGPVGTVLRSTDGLTWTKRLSNTTSDLQDITFGDGMWVAVGNEGKIITSTDASAFQLRTTGTELSLKSVAHGAGKFLAVGQSGLILSSSNGADWNISATEEQQDLNAVAYGNSRWVITSANGFVYSSSDATNWTAKKTNFGPWEEITFGNGMFVAVSQDGAHRFHSSDGLQWSAFPIDPEQRVLGLETSGGEVWSVGAGAYIAKYAPQNSPLLLSAGLLENGRFTLNIHVPIAGTYKVQTANSLGAPLTWTQIAVIEAQPGITTWTSDTPTAAQGYFRVVRE